MRLNILAQRLHTRIGIGVQRLHALTRALATEIT
jgi:hypothetical protein